MNRLLLVLLLLPLACPAQVVIDTLHWSATRRLQLSDFHSSAQPGLGGSDFHYQISYEVRSSSAWGKPAVEAFCLMFRNLSWLSETARNERTLTYNQLLFDLVEIHTRQMKARLIDLPIDRTFKEKAKQIEYSTNSELGAEVNRFRAETGGGDEQEAMQRWQQLVLQRLYNTPELKTVYHASTVGIGLFAGAGMAPTVGPVSQVIGPTAGIVMGIDVSYRRALLMVHPTVYSGTLRESFSHLNQTWDQGMRISPLLLDVALGHTFRDTPRSRWIPYVGYRLLDLAPRDRNDERYKGLSLVSHAPTVGLLVDVKLGNNVPKADHSEASFWFIRIKAGYSPLLNTGTLTGGMFNLQLGIGGLGHTRKITYKPEPTVLMPR